MVGYLAGSCTPMAPTYISCPRWCTSLTSFDQWCVVYLEPPRYICHGLVNVEPIRCSWPCRQCTRWRASCGFGCRCGSHAIMQLLFQQSMSFMFCASFQFLDRVLGFLVGYVVGDAQSTLCRGLWSSTGPVLWYGVERPLLCNNRCRGRLCSRMLGSTVDTFLRLFLVRYGRLSHFFYVKAVL